MRSKTKKIPKIHFFWSISKLSRRGLSKKMNKDVFQQNWFLSILEKYCLQITPKLLQEFCKNPKFQKNPKIVDLKKKFSEVILTFYNQQNLDIDLVYKFWMPISCWKDPWMSFVNDCAVLEFVNFRFFQPMKPLRAKIT